MLRHEQIIKEYLKDNNIKVLGMENDGRLLIEQEGNQRIFRVKLIDDSLILKNVYDDIEYTINLVK